MPKANYKSVSLTKETHALLEQAAEQMRRELLITVSLNDVVQRLVSQYLQERGNAP